MKILEDNKVRSIQIDEFKNIINGYKDIIVDIGTGDGEFVYKSAKKNPDDIFIGIDPAAGSLMHYSAKAGRKLQKGGLKNVLFVVENAYELPDEMAGAADKVYVNLPWGSLRDGIIKGEENLLYNIKKISVKGAVIDVCITYSDLYEKNEIHKRQLPGLTHDYINNILKQKYEVSGMKLVKLALWDNEMLKKLDTRWAKKLAYGKERDIFHFKCIIK